MVSPESSPNRNGRDILQELQSLQSTLRAANGNGSTEKILDALSAAPKTIRDAVESENGTLDQAVSSLTPFERARTLQALSQASEVVDEPSDATGVNPAVLPVADRESAKNELSADATGLRPEASDPDATQSMAASPSEESASVEVSSVPARSRRFTDRAMEALEHQGYENVSVLGAGGLGIVFKATDSMFDRTVAVKIPRPENTAEAFERFRNETKITGHLGASRSNVILAHKAGEIEVDGQTLAYLEMEYVPGATFKELNATLFSGEDRSPAPGYSQIIQNVVRGPFLEACKGVAHLHNSTEGHESIIHRDLKPGNIMVEFDGGNVLESTGAKIFDLGLAGEEGTFKPGSGRSSRLASGVTMTGDTIGTPKYMSPEQARGETKTLDVRSDIYAMGTVLYEMLAGRAPYEGDDVFTMLRQVQDVSFAPENPRKKNPAAPYELCAIAEKAMSNDPDSRYGSIFELIEDTERYLKGKPVRAVQEQLAGLSKGYYWASTEVSLWKKQLAITGLIGAMTVGGAVGIGNYLEGRRAEREHQAKIVAADNTVDTIQERLMRASEIQHTEPGDAIEELGRAIDIAATQSGPIGQEEFKALHQQAEEHLLHLNTYLEFSKEADKILSAALSTNENAVLNGETVFSKEIKALFITCNELVESNHLSTEQLQILKDFNYRLAMAEAIAWAPTHYAFIEGRRQEVFTQLYDKAMVADDASVAATGEHSLTAVKLALKAATQLGKVDEQKSLEELISGLKPRDAFEYAVIAYENYIGQRDPQMFDAAMEGLKLDRNHFTCNVLASKWHIVKGDYSLAAVHLSRAFEQRLDDPLGATQLHYLFFRQARMEYREAEPGQKMNQQHLDTALKYLKLRAELGGDEIEQARLEGVFHKQVGMEYFVKHEIDIAKDHFRQGLDFYRKWASLTNYSIDVAMENHNRAGFEFLGAEVQAGSEVDRIVERYPEMCLRYFNNPELRDQGILQRLTDLGTTIEFSYSRGNLQLEQNSEAETHIKLLRVALHSIQASTAEDAPKAGAAVKVFNMFYEKAQASPSIVKNDQKMKEIHAAAVVIAEAACQIGQFETALTLIDYGISSGHHEQALRVLKIGIEGIKEKKVDSEEELLAQYSARVKELSSNRNIITDSSASSR